MLLHADRSGLFMVRTAVQTVDAADTDQLTRAHPSLMLTLLQCSQCLLIELLISIATNAKLILPLLLLLLHENYDESIINAAD